MPFWRDVVGHHVAVRKRAQELLRQAPLHSHEDRPYCAKRQQKLSRVSRLHSQQESTLVTISQLIFIAIKEDWAEALSQDNGLLMA